MAEGSYNQFCPVAMAAEILCTRWTLIVLRELVAGSTRFNELRRGVPRMSPALLSQRLKDLERAGVITRTKLAGEAGAYEYRLTQAGRGLPAIIEAVGAWGHRWFEAEASLEKLDPHLLMWDMRRNIDPRPMPRRRNVIQVIYTELAKAQRNWWLIVEPSGEVDLCSVDPGFDVDLYISTKLRTMTEIWMGYTTIAEAKRRGDMTVTGARQLESAMKSWLTLSPFAKYEKRWPDRPLSGLNEPSPAPRVFSLIRERACAFTGV